MRRSPYLRAMRGVLDDADAAKARVDSLIKGQKVDTSDVAAQLAADRYWRRADQSANRVNIRRSGQRRPLVFHDI